MSRSRLISCAAALALACACAFGPDTAFADEEAATSAPVSGVSTTISTGVSAMTEYGRAALSDEYTEGASGEPAPQDEPIVTVDTLSDNLVDPTQRADNSFIYDTSIGAISDQSSLYNNRTVQVEGEVIGDCISAGNGNCWIVLSSHDEGDTESISVLMSADQASQIDSYGRYGVTGTTLQVRGEYHQACDEHEGLSDIHATNSSVVALGQEHRDAFIFDNFVPGLVAIAIGIVLLLVFRFARERMR